jgi:hypothetical protein
MATRTERVRAFIQHHHFAEAIVAFLAFMASWWSPSVPVKIAFGFLGAVLLVVAIISKIRGDRAQRTEHARLQRTIRTLTDSSGKRPIVQVAYTWQTGEPKEKPFTITNAGDDEARTIEIHRITLADRSFTFDVVGQLLPSNSTTREPRVQGDVGMLFRTLIDGIENAIRLRSIELKAKVSTALPTLERFDQVVRAEMKAHDELEDIPVIVTFEDRNGHRKTLEYRLAVTAFADVSRAELHFVREA